MITAFTGVPGGGKSLHAAQIMYDSIMYKDRLVISNVRISDSFLHKRCTCSPLRRFKKEPLPPHFYIPNNELDPHEIIQMSQAWYSKKPFSESGILLVIDEAQLVFNSRSWFEKGRQDWIYLFTNSRHFGIKVILICQMLEMLDKQIRGCIEIEYIHRDMKHFGVIGRIITLLVGGKLFVVVGKYLGVKQQISSEYVLGRRMMYDFYDSYEVMGYNKQDVSMDTVIFGYSEEADEEGQDRCLPSSSTS